jgi:hypothetical protein
MRRTIYTGLAAAAAAALVLIPSAGSNNGDTLVLGSENNFAGLRTHLVSSAGDEGLLVSDRSENAIAIYGEATATDNRGIGVYGVSGAFSGDGVRGFLSSANPQEPCGLLGCFDTPAGVLGKSNSQNAVGPGVLGIHPASSGSAPGVLGQTYSASGYGVEGGGTSGSSGVGGFSDDGTGVRGEAGSTTFGGGDNGVLGISHNKVKSGVYGEDAEGGFGVLGRSSGNAAGGQNQGVYGWVYATDPVGTAAGVRGQNDGTNANGYGVWGSHAGSGIGVLGTTPSGLAVVGASGFIGVLGYAPPAGYAGYFIGNVNITGTLTKGAGAFRIDHPLDPAHEYLQHSFVESPDMKDVYDGVATTDEKGFATVKLPTWFQALNRSFRYQLTSLTGLQEVAIAKEIAHNRFTIQSQKPHSRVSWQVTGIRHDAYANAHRIPVELAKPAKEQGRYLHPELYGKPRSDGVLSPRLEKVLQNTSR